MPESAITPDDLPQLGDEPAEESGENQPEGAQPEVLDEIPDGAYQFLLEMAAQANAPKKAHTLVEQLLALLEQHEQQARQRIRFLERRVETLEEELADKTDE